jgi:Flp pilus assembly protein TadB
MNGLPARFRHPVGDFSERRNPMSIPHATPGQAVNARPLGTGLADTRTTAEGGETIPQRGLLLSVMQAIALVVGFALLFAVVAPGIFVSLVSIVTALVILGGLHYWVWGRWMSRR